MSLFTILTCNIQCSIEGTRHEQLLHLVEIIKLKNYTCVCLQDVNLTSLSILKSKLHNYSIIETLNNGTPQIILYDSNCSLKEEFCYSIPSKEEREILGCKLTYLEKEYEILNVWLEHKSSEIRKKQIEVLLEVVSPQTLVVGDFNIVAMNEAANSLILKNKMCDAWINGGCNPQLRDTTFIDKRWHRTVRLLYFKTNYSVVCNGLLNNDCDNSAVTYEVTFYDAEPAGTII